MVVVGSVNADLVVRVPRLPAPGETVIGGTFTRGQGGKGANQAAAAARLGARTWLVGLVGDDDLGAAARADLAAFGVDLTHLGTGSLPTGVAEIVVDEAGENLIAVASGANAEVTGEAVAAAVEAVAAAVGAVAERAVVLANLEVPDTAVRAAAEAAKERGFAFVLNPAPARPLAAEVLARCDVITPNEVEVVGLGAGRPDELLAAGCAAVVVTRGALGAEIHRPGSSPVSVPAFPVEVVDTTGAGDAFSAGLAWALASGRDLEAAVRLASAAGALATRGLGARSALPTAAEVLRLSAPTGGERG